MKTWCANVSTYLLMLLLLPSLLSGQEERVDKAGQAKREEWAYQVQIREKGTRSEGRTGILTKDKAEVIGKSEGEIVETPFGKFKWFGKPVPEDPVFRDRGWLNKWSGGRKALDGNAN
jgi:hypothetical protein